MLDLADIFALSGLGLLYDKIEARYGRLAAWLVTLAIALGIIATLIAILVWVL